MTLFSLRSIFTLTIPSMMVLSACSSAVDVEPGDLGKPATGQAAEGLCTLPTAGSLTPVTVTYRTLPAAQTMDLYIPAHPTGAVVLAVHGGGFTGGTKADAVPVELCQALASTGTICASPSYTLATALPNIYPAAPKDVMCALRYLRANVATYGGDPTRMGMAGFSVGSNLAAVTRSYLAAGYTVPGSGVGDVLPHGTVLTDSSCPTAPAAGDGTLVKQVALWYGVYGLDPINGDGDGDAQSGIGHFSPISAPTNYSHYLGYQTVASTVGSPAYSALAADASPWTYAHDTTTEVLCHGSLDVVVYPAQSTVYDAATYLDATQYHDYSSLVSDAGDCAAYALLGKL